MRILVSTPTMRSLRTCILAAFFVPALQLSAQDAELTNYKSGIDVYWGVGDGSDKGTAYYEEYFYHDKLTYDAKVVYIKSNTLIHMRHNERNNAFYHVSDGGLQFIGANGKDNIPNNGDEGIIRYKIDRDRQYFYKWSDNTPKTQTARVLPAYTGPFTLASQNYGPSDPGVPVVGTTGSNGGAVGSITNTYYRGLLDTANVTGGGDEWHVLSYADDDNEFLRLGANFVDQKFYASDAKTVLLVVNPKTPCFTARATGSGQFYTTPPKAYWTPKIVPQTTYISGTVSIELRDINGNNVFYRINGGSYTNAGASTVTLNQTNFNDGSNTLEYYYQGNEAFVKTRIVVKNPTHPSLAEQHGNYLWVDNTGYSAVLSRITRAPYLSYYNAYRGSSDQSGHPAWNNTSRKGYRLPVAQALTNAFVAKVLGWDYTATGATKSHGRYAKEMILEFSRNTDPVGFEMQMSSDASGNRELHAFGYNDAQPVVSTLFAYDLIAANFRSDQVSGGLTPIEDYFVRDRLAGFAYEAMQWSANMTALGDPGMWGGARMMTSVSIAMILREYSTPYYGTSGFGNVQTTYPLCPYGNDQLTWKQALFDGTAPKSSYPNLTWYTGLSDNGAFSLFTSEAQKVGANTYTEGDWLVKNAYFSYGLMGRHLAVWANMAKMWGGNKTDPRLEIAIEKATKGTLVGAGDAIKSPSRFHMLTFLNSRWPNAVANNISWVQSLPATDNNSDDKAMQDAGVFGFAWYDDQIGGTIPPPPTPTVTAPTNAKVSITVSP